MRDVAIIGAGPIGNYVGYLLATAGLDVVLLEEHAVVGEPAHCTGIIGMDAFEQFDLPRNAVVGELKKVKIISPHRKIFDYDFDTSQALVVDRSKFDRGIAQMAILNGAQLMMDATATGIEVLKDRVDIKIRKDGRIKRIAAKMAVISTGLHYGLQERLGMGKPRDFLKCAQVETDVMDRNDYVEVYFGKRLAPGSFAWVVPIETGNGPRARIGLSSTQSASAYLDKFLVSLNSRVLNAEHLDVKRSAIPLTPIARTFHNRVLAVGDAAGVVKPSTGGGVFYGLICAGIAAEVVKKAFKIGRFDQRVLSEYERQWKKRLGLELKIGYYFRRVASKFTDAQLNDLFEVITSDEVLPLLRRKAKFDWHKDLMLSIVKQAAVRNLFFGSLMKM
ncbi:MAG: NAD(P)/FAD-dependent oxidoreductase [Candidatus Omnitrophica bacterium]|nr:NAD(P)/FAD-dependent oxidoreductase [Candidatus Omnitrophota bacterium]